MANEKARQLRKRTTRQEVALWSKLREQRASGFHFRRQAPFRDYVLDFVCFSYRLAIEVDGGQHGFERSAARDARQDAELSAEGFKVLRFWNSDIDHNLTGVLETVVFELRQRSPTRPALRAVHPPHEGEGGRERPGRSTYD